MPTWAIVLLIILAVVLVLFVVLAIYGRKLQKKQETAQADIRAGAQTFSILVIDKKRMKMKEAGFPKVVLDQTPKYLRGAKVPVVKAKIGPRVMSLICDEKVFDLIPVKKEVKAVMNGIYIIDVKGLRGALESKPAKKGFFAKMKDKVKKN
ncbi:MAG: hypothetical protein J6B85_11330 [Lachnospiraceae bacterium]|nr:hypothetical protein [Lachnospiraceae bacterium]